MAATIRDIKQKTGLSLATISKYLNGGNVLPENREKIEAAIRELHYEVNEIARGLVTNKTNTIGMIVYDIESMFSGVIIRHIGDCLRKAGYALLVCDSCNNEQVENDNVRFLLNKKVDGIIVIPVSGKEDFLLQARAKKVPVVLLDRSFAVSDFDCVKIDNRTAAYRATNYLIERRHKKIAIIASRVDYTGRERYKGFCEAMDQAGLTVKKEYCMLGTHTIEFGHESMRQLLAMKHRPTAVLMTNYETSLGAVMALNESEYDCPDDISMMGFDDLIMSHVVKPKLCMVIQPMKELCEKAVELVLTQIHTKEERPPIELSMGTALRDGNSVKPLQEN
ncbi:MAG: LacI family DNA-binding transcriptional regulator [Eubacterium sp.]|nr:LacI family DNA-binding transcriptional regulator [Eubacterium sp.]